MFQSLRVPNMRVLRPRSSPSALRSPLTRHTLDGNVRLRRAISAVLLGILFVTGLRASEKGAPPPGCHWQEIPEIKVTLALPDGWVFHALPKTGDVSAYEVVPAGGGVPKESRSRYELKFQRVSRPGIVVTRAKEHVQNAVASAVESTPLEEETIGVMTSFASVGQLSPDSAGVPQLIVAVLALGNSRTGALYMVRFEIPTSEADAVLPQGNMLFRTISVDDEQ